MADLYRYQTPDGRSVPLLLPPEQASSLGLDLYSPVAAPPPPRAEGKLASMGGGMDGAGGAPSVSDASNGGTGGAGGSGGSGGFGGTLNMAPPSPGGGTGTQSGVLDQGGPGGFSASGGVMPQAERDKLPPPAPFKEIDVPEAPASPPRYAPRRVQKIPGGDKRVAFAVQKGQPVPEGDVHEVEQASQGVDDQISRGARREYLLSEENRLEGEGELLRRQEEERQTLLEKRQQLIERQKAVDSAKDLIRKREVEAEQIGREKPAGVTDFWQDRGVFGQIAAAISIALGAYAQGLNGGTNPGAELINNAIDRWVDDRRTKYEESQRKAEKGVQLAKDDFAQSMDLYHNAELAALDQKLRAQAVVDGLIANRAQKIGNQKALDAAQLTIQDRQAQRAQWRMELEQAAEDRVTEQWQNIPDQYVQTGGPPQVPKEARALAVRLPNGEFKFARSTEEQKRLQLEVSRNAEVAENLQRVLRLTDEAGKRVPWSEAKARAQSLLETTKLIYDKSLGVQYSEHVANALDKALGHPDDFVQIIEDQRAKLQENIRLQHNNIRRVEKDFLDSDPKTLDAGPQLPSTRKSDE